MEVAFVLYFTCILVIVFFICVMIRRNMFIQDYQDEYFTNGEKPLKYIPKKIFQLVSDKKKIDKKFEKNIAYIKKLNPDWEYTLMDDADIQEYLSLHYPEIIPYYNRINPKYGAAKADLFRYLLIYREGGVYLDLKSAMKYPLNRIIHPDDQYILSYWNCPCQKTVLRNDDGEFQQWHVISRPNHPFLKAVIDLVTENISTYRISDGVGKNGVLKLTGPIAYTEAITPLLDKYPHKLVDTNEMIGLIYNNLDSDHTSLYSKTHYSNIDEPIIISNINGKN